MPVDMHHTSWLASTGESDRQTAVGLLDGQTDMWPHPYQAFRLDTGLAGRGSSCVLWGLQQKLAAILAGSGLRSCS